LECPQGAHTIANEERRVGKIFVLIPGRHFTEAAVTYRRTRYVAHSEALNPIFTAKQFHGESLLVCQNTGIRLYMKTYISQWALFAIVILSISFATSVNSTFATQRTASAPDDRIVDQVRMRLATDADVKGSALEVRAKNGVVTIKGTVDTPKAKKRAEQLTRKVKGVKDVINELVVRQESR
jgi:hypothetical protein